MKDDKKLVYTFILKFEDFQIKLSKNYIIIML